MFITPFVQRLLLITIAVFIVTSLTQMPFKFELYNYYSGEFIPTQFVTHMFMHANINHIFSNMLGLFFFGPLLEQFLGSKRFLTLYFVSGIGAGILYWLVGAYEIYIIREHASLFLLNPSPEAFAAFMHDHAYSMYQSNLEFIERYSSQPTNIELITEAKSFVVQYPEAMAKVPMVGASGAIFGVLAAFALLFPNTEMFLLFIPVPIKAKYLVSVYIIIEIYQLIKSNPNDNVAHFAHISGALVAFLLIWYWRKNSRSFY
jgi:membrane associated rhomboid family serine protease